MNGLNITAICVADGFGILLAVTMLVVRNWNRGRNKKESLMLKMLLLCCIVSSSCDIVSSALDGVGGEIARFFCFFGNSWLYAMDLVVGTIFFNLLVTHISDRKMPQGQKILIYVLDGLGAAALFINCFYPLVFGLNDNNTYFRGPLFFLFLALQIIFLIDSIAFYIVNRKVKEHTKYFPVWQFVFPIIFGIIVQSIFYGISALNPSIVVGVVACIMGLFNESDVEFAALEQHKIDTKIILAQKEQLEKQQEKLEKALIAAEASNNAKTAFLNNMSHDIRTPMNAILGYTDIAYRHKDEPETVADSLTKIRTSGKHLLNLINDVLEMSRIESGKLNIVNSPVDMRELIYGVEKMSLVLSIPKSIDFKVSIGEIFDPYVLVDELHLNEILINLVSNAVKYTPEGGKVYFSVSQSKSPENGITKFTFEVKDNGIGMSSEFQEHLFESFSREQSYTVNKLEGAGLGLAIVKKIVELAKGTITVDSQLGKGSSFVVELPIKLMSQDQKDEFITEQKKREHNFEDVSIKGKKVLLVEDNEMNREIAKDIIFEAGLEADVAEDGAIAVKKFKNNGSDYDIILMDIQMPIMNGYEATKEIRKLPDGKDIPIIALSANAFKEDVDKSLQSGMNAHVAKPINIKILLETMQSLLR